MRKYLVPIIGGFVTALAVSFLFGFASDGKADNAWIYVSIGAGAVVAIVLFNLSGNRRTAPADAAARQRALSFVTEDRKGALYLVRTGFVGKMAGMNVAVDGREVAQLKSPRFTRIELTPGPHTLTASFGGGLAGQTKPSALWFDCWEGEIVVMRLSMSVGVLQNPVKIERGSYTDALRGELAGMQMTAPDVRAV